MVRNLKKLRMEMKISQLKLAEIIGTSQQSINKYENHKVEPDINTLTALADFFQTSVDYLIGHTEERHIIEPVKEYELNQDESNLIDKYRNLTVDEKDSIHLIMKNHLIHK